MSKAIIYRENYFHNLDQISHHAGSKDKVAVVLKDNAYGHGLLEIAQLANEYGIKRAVVRNCDEAVKIEKLFDSILILADTNLTTYSHTFHITINKLDDIAQLPKNTQVHLKVDTGMHRNGISLNSLETAIHGLFKQGLVLTGVFTHHHSADKISTDFFTQARVFGDVKNKVISICEKLSHPIPEFHSCNSSALFRTKNFDEDFARVGIAQYGYLETDPIFDNPNLKPILSLYANKLSSREIKKGQSVGYGATYQAQEDMIIGCYDVGYGDGFLRINERQEYFTPDGYRVLGRVSMDNLSLNTDLDEVCLFDDVKALAKVHDTITYEITTTLSPNIKKEIR